MTESYDSSQGDRDNPSLADVQRQIAEMEMQVARLRVQGETPADDPEDSAQPDSSVQSGVVPTDAPRILERPVTHASLVLSTLLSLAVVLTLLLAVRFLLPPLLEWSRYAWFRGQLRAEYETAGERLRSVSLNGPWQISPVVSQRVTPSVVHINLRAGDNIRGTDSGRFSSTLGGQGSGVIMDRQGNIVTNFHVVEGDGEIQVTLSDGRRVPASLVGGDKKTDLAVVRVAADGLLPMDWGNSDEVDIGDPVWAVGSPYGLTGSVTFGILSGKHRVDLSDTRYALNQGGASPHYADLMQTDAALNPGNSGGPLVNARGQLIGINTAIVGEHYRGVCFAIPSNVVRRVIDRILSTGKMERGMLGILLPDWIRLGNKRLRDDSGEEQDGVVVQGFPPDSPAAGAGMIPGDRIVAFNDQEVRDWLNLLRMIGEAEIDSTARVEVIRGTEKLVLEVPIRPLPR
jgi:S1-C subfamily serine protease